MVSASCRSCLHSNMLLLLTLVGVIVGICFGVGMRYLPEPLTDLEIEYLKFPGTMLLQGLKMVVLPLIIFSIISGISSLDGRTTGRLGGIAVAYYGITTLFAVIVGIILTATIKPGVGSTGAIEGSGPVGQLAPVDSLLDLVRNLIPSNIIYATFAQKQTWRRALVNTYDCTSTNNATIDDLNSCKISKVAYELNDPRSGYNDETCPYTELNDTAIANLFQQTRTFVDCSFKLNGDYTQPRENILGVLFFSIAFALSITKSTNQESKKVLLLWFSEINDAVLKIVTLVIWYAPVGIIFLIAAEVIAMNDVSNTFQRLGIYMGTVLGGLLIHSMITLPLIYIIGTKNFRLRAPLDFILYVKGISQALLTAFATASSSATLPITINNLEVNCGIDPRVTRFVLPIGATINMDGTALYEAVAAIFIAQYEGLQLGFGDYVIISITATVASIGAAGIPQAGLVTLVIVMTAIGLPSDRITLILAVDWLLDRFRTTVNVLGDSLGCAVVQANMSLQRDEKKPTHPSISPTDDTYDEESPPETYLSPSNTDL